MKFTEAKLEQAFIDLLKEEGYTYLSGDKIEIEEDEVLIKQDLKDFLKKQYKKEGITDSEMDSISGTWKNCQLLIYMKVIKPL